MIQQCGPGADIHAGWVLGISLGLVLALYGIWHCYGKHLLPPIVQDLKSRFSKPKEIHHEN